MAEKIQKIAVTGGPGSGKSSLCNAFSEMGYPVLDLDLFAKKAVEKGKPAYRAVVAEFGLSSIAEDGNLNRSWLKKEMVGNALAKKRLEAIIHPEVYRLLDEKTSAYLGKGRFPVIVEFPLLFEMQKERLFDLVIVVFVPYATQVERVMLRDQVSREAAEGLVNLQMPLREKALRADLVLDNSGSLENLKNQLQNWIRTGRIPVRGL